MSRAPRILPAVTSSDSFAVAATVGQHSLALLRAFIAAARAGDPLAPVTVVVPSNYAGLSLRRLLGTQDGLVNVRFLGMSRVAELLAAARFVPDRRPLTPWVRAEAVRLALETDGSIFGAAAGHPGTARALDTTFRDLRHASPGALEHLSRSSERARAVAQLYRRFRDLTAGHFDIEDLLGAAALAVEQQSPALRDLGRVILYLPRSATPAELRLLSSLIAADRLDIILGLTGDPVVDDATLALATRLGVSLPPGDHAPPSAGHIIDAVDTVEEARAIVRRVLEAARSGTPFHRIGILFPASGPFSGVLTEELRAAGIPFHGRSTRPLAASMPARVLLGLLGLPEARFRRTAVMDWLTSGPILDPGSEDSHRLAPSAQWDEISRDAGISVESQAPRDRAHWQRRLEAFASQPREASRADAARSLAAFVSRLKADLEPPPARSSAALAAWARTLLLRYLGFESDARHWGDEAAATSYASILALLESASHHEIVPAAGPRAALVSAADRRRYLASILEQALASSDGRLGPFGDGVYLGAIGSARGMDFSRVFIAGMVEGVFPAPSAEDPLLPDAEREDAAIETRHARSLNARFDYLCALATAPVRTLSFARSDIGGQARQSPSRWLIESVSVLAAKPVAVESLNTLRSQPWFTVATSFEHSLHQQPGEANSRQDWELEAFIASGGKLPSVFDQDPSLRSGLGAASATLPAWARRTPEDPSTLSPWAGGASGLSDGVSGIYSPTSFETLAACPFKYFLGNVLHVKETAEPGDAHRLEARDRGAIVHDSLERFFVDAAAEMRLPGPSDTWAVEDHARLAAAAGEICDRFEAAGKTGGAALWYVDRARILRDLKGFLAADDERRLVSGNAFLHAELSFGFQPREGEESANQPPVAVPLAGGDVVHFRGRIDRVDRSPGGELIVYDYKTGRASEYKNLSSADDPLSGGRHLQLPIYALAARAAFGDAPVSAYYWAASEQEGYKAYGYQVDEATLTRLGEVLAVLAHLVGDGLFPQVPGKPSRNSYENCRYCPFDRVCPSASRTGAWESRKWSAGLADYVALTEAVSSEPAQPGVPSG